MIGNYQNRWFVLSLVLLSLTLPFQNCGSPSYQGKHSNSEGLDTDGEEADVTEPVGTVTAPLNAATINGTILISAMASDENGVAGAKFYVDDVMVGSEDVTEPFEANWDTNTVSNGSHVLKVQVRDDAGNTGDSPNITVTVSNTGGPDTTAPAVSITAPTNGGKVTGVYTITANATDNVGVAGVKFFRGGTTQIGVEDTSAPYSVSWDTAGLPEGVDRSLTAVARDAAGNTTTSTAVVVQVENINPNAKYSWLKTNVFNVRCMPCHNATNHSGSLILTDYNSVLGKVVKGDAAGSKLYQVVSGPNWKMPKNSTTQLTAAHQQAISDWIENQAPND